MDCSPAPSKTHISVPGMVQGQRTLAMETSKGAIGDFRRHMLTSPGIPDAERRMYAEHNVPSGECVASAALFQLRRRRNELAPQATKLESSLEGERAKREKIAQELFKSRNKFDSLVGIIADAEGLASKSKAAIASAEKELFALGENVAICIVEAQMATESFERISEQRGLAGKALDGARGRTCYDKMAELSEACEHYAGLLAESYEGLTPKADLLTDGIGGGLRVLRHGEKGEIMAFLEIMAKSADSVSNGYPRDKSSMVLMDSEIGKAAIKINSLASSLCKASAWVAKQGKRQTGKAPGPDEDIYGRFIDVARETNSQLSTFKTIARDMLDAHGKYVLTLIKLDSLVKDQARLEESLSQLPDTTGDEKLLSQMRQEIADIGLLEQAVGAALSRLQDSRLKKEASRSQHAQNRLSREEWEKAKSGGAEGARQRFTYTKEPQAEPAMVDAAEARKQKFMEAALSLFEGSLNKNALLREQFEATLPEIAELYLKGKCTISSKSLFTRFPKRTKHEKVLRNDASDYDIVRVGLSSINEYRLLVDVKSPRQPLIYFVGHKEECEAFMKSIPKKISGCREKALSNGVGSLFSLLSPE